ncbi:hypothetical protein K439DRAFT_1618312 [Ramaria rubella]|nr:hypothetical protein K439DRAFT_1618312 [Ramaria rubella]
MFSILVIFLAQAYLATNVSAYTYDIAVSDLVSRQVNNASSQVVMSSQCNATCNAFALLNVECPPSSPHCHCNAPFLSAQGNCLLCRTETASDEAAVQFLLDEEISQCHSEGIDVNVQLQLPPAAADIVHSFDVGGQILRRMQTAFLALQILGGHVGLVLIFVFGVFSRRVNRDPTFISFCLAWIFSSVVFSLSLYKGVEDNTTLNTLGEVNPDFCLAQAALTAGAQVLTACSTLAWVIQLWITLRAVINGIGYKPSVWITWTVRSAVIRLEDCGIDGLILLAYIAALCIVYRACCSGRLGGSPPVFSILCCLTYQTIRLGALLDRPTTNSGGGFILLPGWKFLVRKKRFTLRNINPHMSSARVLYGVVLACLMAAMVFDILIINILYRHWRAFRSVNTKAPVSFSILLRVMTFSVFRIGVAIAYGTVFITPPSSQFTQGKSGTTSNAIIPPWVDMLQATIPLVAFLIIGTTGDVLESVQFWKRWRPSGSPTSTISSTSTEDFSTRKQDIEKDWNGGEVV